MKRLTDEELADVAERIVEDQPKCHVCGGTGKVVAPSIVRLGRAVTKCCGACDGTGFFALSTDAMRSIVAELRELRALLAVATKVVEERRAKIMHARETMAMCRLAKVVDSAALEARAAREGGK